MDQSLIYGKYALRTVHHVTQVIRIDTVTLKKYYLKGNTYEYLVCMYLRTLRSTVATAYILLLVPALCRMVPHHCCCQSTTHTPPPHPTQITTCRSLGATVHEMVTTKPPWGGLVPEAAMFQIGIGKLFPALPEDVSESLNDFYRRCLTR